eukprot:gene64-537_t
MSSFGVMDRVVCHAMIAVPFIVWITSPGRFGGNAKKSMLGALLTVLAAKDFQKAQPNLYDVLNVPVKSTKDTIQSAYMRMQQNYKSDTEAYSKSQMDKAKEAKDVLKTGARKKMYIRFGDIGPDLGEQDFLFICGFAMFASIICYCMAHLMTAAEHTRSARIWIIVYLVATTCLELYARFADPKMLSILPFVGRRLVHEQMAWLRGMFPTILAIACATAGETFADAKGHNRGLLKEVIKTNGDIMAGIREFCSTAVFEGIAQMGNRNLKYDDIKTPRPKEMDTYLPKHKSHENESVFGNKIHIALGVIVCLPFLYNSFVASDPDYEDMQVEL